MISLMLSAMAFVPLPISVESTPDQITIRTSAVEATVRKKGYVSGVAGGSFVDRKSGFHDAGFGLDVVDWLMEKGSDAAYRGQLTGDLPYDYNNLVHGKRAKRSIEGPQICTQAKELDPEVIRGSDFVAVKQSYRYTTAAPGHTPGSLWEQTLVFPEGKRFFLSCDRVTSANASDSLFLRLDMPAHIRHTNGDTFSEVYLSYAGRIPASEFVGDFAPDEKNLYVRRPRAVPKRFIRAYHLRDPKTGKDGPWLAGMTLDPAAVSEAWCHQRGYVCMIEEIGGRPVRPGQSFGAAFLVGFFDSIDEMNSVYDQYAGHDSIEVNDRSWRLTHPPAPSRRGRGSRLRPSASPPRVGEASGEGSRESLENRLNWFQDQKFGLLMHWGAYSQWGCIESWPLVEEDRWARPDDLRAWTDRDRDIDRFRRDYWSLPKTFNPTHFEPERWADAAKRAGMKYVVFTTKHHDGFGMFDTKQSDYKVTAPDVPFHTNPRSNVVKEVFDAFRARGFGIGAYFSKADWHHPDYWSPDLPARTRNPNYDTLKQQEKWNRFADFVYNQIEELMTGYGAIDILWLDAGQVRPPAQDIHMDRIADMARGHQPGLIIVDRTVGGKYENYRTPEQEVPDNPLPFVWESCITMGNQWSYKPDDHYKSARDLVHLLVDVVAKGGNLLLNIGPQPDGRLPETAQQRLKEIGDWMRINGEAIYGTRAIAPYKEGQLAFTRKGTRAYAIYLLKEGERPPASVALTGLHPKPGSVVRLLGRREALAWRSAANGAVIDLPTGVSLSTYAFALKFDLDTR